jgi:hypothetical protein
MGRLRFLNPLLARFGRQIVELRVGHWFVKPGGGLGRISRPAGWYLARRGEWEGVPEGATALDRFRAAHAKEIGGAP